MSSPDRSAPVRRPPAVVIAVLDYGIGNLRSAEKAFQHLGADARLVADPDEAATAEGMVLPGVGAFGPCASALHATGLDTVALDAIARGLPFLGICIGFQLLYEGSDEDPGHSGLGVLSGVVRPLPDGVKHPQMQWNQLDRRPEVESGLLRGFNQGAWVYFVHSFAPEITDDTTSTCNYGGPVTASAERGPLWGTQFHPEKSSAVGLGILDNFVGACRDSAVSSSPTS
ncbi:MAG TPA: imidazole glycerol phosphate synthase subunit HisH [Acidimicrobiales bacterium]|nr:imidazole glycerol phosphate synthase subunit HisH [Acidimicrobiales bacterium]